MVVMPPLHPLIVHTPLVMIIFSLLFDLVGRALDADWWRKAGLAMLVIGVLGAGAAVLTGRMAGDAAEHQGVAEHAVDEHEESGYWALGMAAAALVFRLAAIPKTGARGAISLLALLLQLVAAAAVTMAGYRGGMLVYEHGAGVKVHGHAVSSDGPAKAEGKEKGGDEDKD